uniref:Uncharacterized protein n=1 Tax=Branchiostoma floridae TaxID=7739 RepID=C3YJT2_BRAFL|eukprot:XP_002603378.1 hypothetical protein BRAFLDRAFT_80371 [Branchiostoma floridae]
MPYKTGHADWSGLDLGLFIGAGVLVTAGLYENGVRCEAMLITFTVADKTDTEISSEQFLSEGDFDYESGHLSQHVPVSPRLKRKLRCAVLYADWREHSYFCHRDDVTTNQKVRFSWFRQEDDDDLDDVTEVKVYCAVLAGVWREECGLVENHVTSMTGSDDDTGTGTVSSRGTRTGSKMF